MLTGDVEELRIDQCRGALIDMESYSKDAAITPPGGD